MTIPDIDANILSTDPDIQTLDIPTSDLPTTSVSLINDDHIPLTAGVSSINTVPIEIYDCDTNTTVTVDVFVEPYIAPLATSSISSDTTSTTVPTCISHPPEIQEIQEIFALPSPRTTNIANKNSLAK